MVPLPPGGRLEKEALCTSNMLVYTRIIKEKAPSGRELSAKLTEGVSGR